MDETELAGKIGGMTLEHLDVGTKIRLRRKVRGLSLKDVADATDISISQLSQIERGVSAPSLRALQQICHVLLMPLGWLFEASEGEENPDGVVVHAKHRRSLDFSSGMVKELLTPDTCRSIQMMKVFVKPGGSSGAQPYFARGTAECGTVLKGTLGLDIDGRRFEIPAGDTFAFEGNHDVRFWCIGDETCEVIWTATPALY